MDKDDKKKKMANFDLDASQKCVWPTNKQR